MCAIRPYRVTFESEGEKRKRSKKETKHEGKNSSSAPIFFARKLYTDTKKETNFRSQRFFVLFCFVSPCSEGDRDFCLKIILSAGSKNHRLLHFFFRARPAAPVLVPAGDRVVCPCSPFRLDNLVVTRYCTRCLPGKNSQDTHKM